MIQSNEYIRKVIKFMAFCSKCGTQVDDSAKFCSSCGSPTAANNIFDKVFNNTKGQSGDYDKSDIENNKVFALLSYINFLFVISLIVAPNSKYARFHANQGLVLFICEVVYGIVMGVMTAILRFIGLEFIAALFSLTGLVFLVLAIIGITNAVNGKAEELPVIGSFKIL